MKIADIEVPANRKRSLKEKTVVFLMDSIQKIGLLNAVTISRGCVLISGLHRLEACKRLGWTEIDARFVDMDELQQELAEIDENLVRNELTVLERSEHLARRKEIYEAVHPRTRHGGAAGKAGGGKVVAKDPEAGSFVEQTSAATGRSRSTIAQEVQIAHRISPEVKVAILGTEVADSKADLIELARMEPEEQREAIKPVLDGTSKTVRQPRGTTDKVGMILKLISRLNKSERSELVEALKASGVVK